MMTPHESLKATLGSIFDRKGGAGTFTQRFEAFVPIEQQQLLEGANLGQDELSVVASKMADGRRILITTERILQLEPDGWSSITVSEITDVEPVKFGSVKKAEMDQLVLRTKSSGDKCLTTEAGPPYFGIWNMLLNLVARNRASVS